MPNPKVVDGEVFCRLCDRRLEVRLNTETGDWKSTCTHCKVTYQPSCDDCGQPLSNHKEDEHRKQLAYSNGNRICYKCDQEKPNDEFYFKSSKGGWQNICRDCQASYYKEWYDNKKKLKESVNVEG